MDEQSRSPVDAAREWAEKAEKRDENGHSELAIVMAFTASQAWSMLAIAEAMAVLAPPKAAPLTVEDRMAVRQAKDAWVRDQQMLERAPCASCGHTRAAHKQPEEWSPPCGFAAASPSCLCEGFVDATETDYRVDI